MAQLVETLHYKPEGRGFDSSTSWNPQGLSRPVMGLLLQLHTAWSGFFGMSKFSISLTLVDMDVSGYRTVSFIRVIL